MSLSGLGYLGLAGDYESLRADMPTHSAAIHKKRKHMNNIVMVHLVGLGGWDVTCSVVLDETERSGVEVTLHTSLSLGGWVGKT